MKPIRIFTGHVHAPPKSTYRKLCDEIESDNTKVLDRDEELRTLHVGGQWWFDGLWTVAQDGDEAAVTLEVSCKGGPVVRWLASRAIKRTLRGIEDGWDEDLATLSRPVD